MQQALMLGAGFAPPARRSRAASSCPDSEVIWTTLDCNPDCQPDILFDLNDIEIPYHQLPVDAETFDEIHAYEVMEHYGHQGDHIGFFRGMRELWRVLKPQGILFGTCPLPSSPWAWADPGHRRVVSSGTLAFLGLPMYRKLGDGPVSDYRRYVDPCWWNVDFEEGEHHTKFALEKIRMVAC